MNIFFSSWKFPLFKPPPILFSIDDSCPRFCSYIPFSPISLFFLQLFFPHSSLHLFGIPIYLIYVSSSISPFTAGHGHQRSSFFFFDFSFLSQHLFSFSPLLLWIPPSTPFFSSTDGIFLSFISPYLHSTKLSVTNIISSTLMPFNIWAHSSTDENLIISSLDFQNWLTPPALLVFSRRFLCNFFSLFS